MLEGSIYYIVSAVISRQYSGAVSERNGTEQNETVKERYGTVSTRVTTGTIPVLASRYSVRSIKPLASDKNERY